MDRDNKQQFTVTKVKDRQKVLVMHTSEVNKKIWHNSLLSEQFNITQTVLVHTVAVGSVLIVPGVTIRN